MQDKELIKRGAECVAGNLIMNRKLMGEYKNGVFVITDAGIAELEVVEVQVKVEKPKAEPKVETKQKAKPKEKEPEPAPLPDPVVDDELSFLDDIK